MTTETIREAAQAAFRAYYTGRAWYRWDQTATATQIRWEQLAAQVLHGNFTTAPECHHYYASDRVGYVEWAAIKPGTRVKWRSVLEAILRAGQRREAA